MLLHEEVHVSPQLLIGCTHQPAFLSQCLEGLPVFLSQVLESGEDRC